ncbi:MAG TPA: ABC transporter ATP-binding protein [Acidimicrobiales bacterium]|nr:ABC transporter ATP-binding protein [Acidimicrobiales bacterium]
MAPAVDCRELVVRYGSLTAVDRLSLSADDGEVVALVGPNGAGKTSTVESLEGYRRPDSGTVRVRGLDPVADHRALVAHVGVMLQRGGVYPSLGPRRVLQLFAAYYPDPEDPVALLERVALTSVATTPWRHLSGGEQQRLSLALALVGRPDVLFLDEPTAGVDPEGRGAIRAVIRELRSRGACVVITTHELAEAEQLADRVVIVRAGRVLADGSPASLAGGGAAVLRFATARPIDTAALSAALEAPVHEEQPRHYRIDAPTPPSVTELTTWLSSQQAELTELRTGRSLEETYLALVGEADGSPAAPARPEPGRRRHRRPPR